MRESSARSGVRPDVPDAHRCLPRPIHGLCCPSNVRQGNTEWLAPDKRTLAAERGRHPSSASRSCWPLAHVGRMVFVLRTLRIRHSWELGCAWRPHGSAAARPPSWPLVTGGPRLPYPDVGALLTAPRDVEAAMRSGHPDRGRRARRGGAAPIDDRVLRAQLRRAHRRDGHPLATHPTLFVKWVETLTGPTDPVAVPEWTAGLEWGGRTRCCRGARCTGPTGPRRRPPSPATPQPTTVRSQLAAPHRAVAARQGIRPHDPLGPILVTADELDPSHGLELTCRVNGEVCSAGPPPTWSSTPPRFWPTSRPSPASR